MPEPLPSRPNWDHLFETALGQDGLFTAAQAAAAGYSPQLLVHYIRIGRVVRIRRGVYRVVHFPVAEHEELTSIWLWSAKAALPPGRLLDSPEPDEGVDAGSHRRLGQLSHGRCLLDRDEGVFLQRAKALQERAAWRHGF